MRFHGTFFFAPVILWSAGSFCLASATWIRRQVSKPVQIQGSSDFAARGCGSEARTLWSGSEPTEAGWRPVSSNVSLLQRSVGRHSQQLRLSTENLLLFGPMDSGTHLLQTLLERNWPEQTWSATAAQHKQQSGGGLWKHQVDREVIYKSLPWNDLSRTAVLAVVRSPISNVEAMLRSPYREIGHCLQHLRRNLEGRDGGDGEVTHSCKIGEYKYNGIMELFNHYFTTYREMRDSGKFASVTIVPYEDMVYTPERVVRNLGEVLGWGLPAEIKVPDNNVKNENTGHSRDAVLERLKRREHLKCVQPALEALCSKLSNSTLAEFIEGNYVDDLTLRLSYSHDCEGFSMAP